jgi:plasmid stabilization system protein ParE
MRYEVEFLPRADLDLVLIDVYLSQYYPSTPANFFSELEKGVSSLTQMPKKYPLYPDTKDIRKLVVRDFIALYQIIEGTAEVGRVEILRVVHGARDIQQIIEKSLTEIE